MGKSNEVAAKNNQDSRAFRTEHLIILQLGSSYTYGVFIIPEEYRYLTNQELTSDPEKVKALLEGKNGVADIHSEGNINALTLHEVAKYRNEVVTAFTERAKELEIQLYLELF